MRTVEVFWDVASPYSYLALTQLPAVAERTGAEVVYRPFLLGGVFKATGNSMPGVVPQKAAFMNADLRRWATQYGVSMKMPGEVPFPINTVAAMRMAVAVGRKGRSAQIASELTRAYWAQGHDVSQPEALAAVASSLGFDPAEIATEIQDPSVKDELRSTTEEAVNRGAFGAPSMFVDGQLYWGNDRLAHVEQALKT